MQTSESIRQAADLLRAAHSITVLTGAGVSKESGVPTFRDAQTGLWEQFVPTQLATPEAFARNPKLVWDWYEFRREIARSARPNPGHSTLAQFQTRFPGMVVITQNIDDLHEQAGSHRVLHLHGSIARNKCFYDCQGSPTLVNVATLDYDPDAGPPSCPHCGRWVRPDVVWFGESLPEGAFKQAYALAESVDVMLVVGTSGIVNPAAMLPQIAYKAGVKVIEINPDSTPLSPLAAVGVRMPSGVALPQIHDALGDW